MSYRERLSGETPVRKPFAVVNQIEPVTESGDIEHADNGFADRFFVRQPFLFPQRVIIREQVDPPAPLSAAADTRTQPEPEERFEVFWLRFLASPYSRPRMLRIGPVVVFANGARGATGSFEGSAAALPGDAPASPRSPRFAATACPSACRADSRPFPCTSPL